MITSCDDTSILQPSRIDAPARQVYIARGRVRRATEYLERAGDPTGLSTMCLSESLPQGYSRDYDVRSRKA